MEIATPSSSVMEQIKGFFEHSTVVVDEEKGNVLEGRFFFLSDAFGSCSFHIVVEEDKRLSNERILMSI